MFSGLDFNGSGSVDIAEFRSAIEYVNSTSAGTGKGFGDRRQINALFRAMDADGNGAVDFGEFMMVIRTEEIGLTILYSLETLVSFTFPGHDWSAERWHCGI